MKLKLVPSLLASVVCFTQAQALNTDEDRSRFVEKPYKPSLPGMASPDVYVQLARKTIKDADPHFLFREFSDPIVTYRIYRDAAPADRDIIAVQFIHQGTGGEGGFVMIKRGTMGIPVVQALIRKDRSKIYINVVMYKA